MEPCDLYAVPCAPFPLAPLSLLVVQLKASRHEVPQAPSRAP
jgi:hypothetical protein